MNAIKPLMVMSLGTVLAWGGLLTPGSTLAQNEAPQEGSASPANPTPKAPHKPALRTIATATAPLWPTGAVPAPDSGSLLAEVSAKILQGEGDRSLQARSGQGSESRDRRDRSGSDRPVRDRAVGDRPVGDRPLGDRPVSNGGSNPPTSIPPVGDRGDRPVSDRASNSPTSIPPVGDRVPTPETPIAETPATIPAVETPVVETPIAAIPAAIPAVETPVIETPIAETPAAIPAVETPVAETPVTENPVTETPVTEAQITASHRNAPRAEDSPEDALPNLPPEPHQDLYIDANPLQRPTQPEQVRIDDVRQLTLADVIQLAQENNRALQVQWITVEQQRAALREAKAQRYPTLTLDSNLDNTGTDSSTNSDSPINDGDTRQNALSLNGSVRVDYGIYDPDRRPSIRAAERQLRQSELLLEQAKEQLRLDVTLDYYNLQESNEQVRIAKSAVDAAQRSLDDARKLERAGVGTRFAVLQAEVQLANEIQKLVNEQASVLKAQRQIAQRISLPQDVNLAAADEVKPGDVWPLTLEESIILAYQKRPELEQRLVEQEISSAQRQVALAAIRPRLGVFGQYTLDQTFQNTDSGDTETSQDTLTQQYRVGLNLNWRFFDGGAAKASARQQELGQETATVQFADDRNQIRQQVEDAYYDLQSNRANIATAGEGVKQAEEALRLARLRFQAGVGTQIDVINAERDLTQAKGNQVTAVINYNRALVRMQRAVSQFSDTPSDTP